MEFTTTQGADMTLTKNTHYAYTVKGHGHGYCNAQFVFQVGQALYFQPYTNQGEKIGTLVSTLVSNIDEIEPR